MAPSRIDIVFSLDTSHSMLPCIDGLRRNLQSIIEPLQGHDVPMRFGLIALHAGFTTGGIPVYPSWTLAGDLRTVYSAGDKLFTSDGKLFSSRLAALEPDGDEDQILGLDLALDFPFGPTDTTRRVVCMFSDERIEDGYTGMNQIGRIPEVIDKIMARRIKVFGALPVSPALEQLAQCENCAFEPVTGGDGLASVDFSKLLRQFGRTISSLGNQGHEGPWKKALFGQDKFVDNHLQVSTAGIR